MLLQATMAVSLVAMATTLWMGFYLFARGFPRTITLRVVAVMFALSAFFYGAYNNIFTQVEGSAAVRAILLVIVLSGWLFFLKTHISLTGSLNFPKSLVSRALRYSWMTI